MQFSRNYFGQLFFLLSLISSSSRLFGKIMDGYKTLRVAELLLDKEASSRWAFPVRDTLRSAAGVPGDKDGEGDDND